MRSMWVGMQWVGLVLLGLMGCASTGPKYKPPKHAEVYDLPPDENRFSDPHAVYPKESLEKDKDRHKDKDKDKDDPNGSTSPPRMGSGGPGLGM